MSRSSFEDQLLRSASARSLVAANSALLHTHSLPARSQSVRCIASIASGAGAGASAPSLACDLQSACSMPCGIAPGLSSCGQLEMLQSPEDSLLGLSIVRVRLGSVGDVAAIPLSSPPPVAGGGRGTGPSNAAASTWKPSAALAAAAAAAPGGATAAAASNDRQQQQSAATDDHQGLQELKQRRADLEEALCNGWSSQLPVGLPLVAEEPHESSPAQSRHGAAAAAATLSRLMQ